MKSSPRGLQGTSASGCPQLHGGRRPPPLGTAQEGQAGRGRRNPLTQTKKREGVEPTHTRGKDTAVSRRILGPGVSPQPAALPTSPSPPQSAWGTALGNLSSSLLKGQGLTRTSVPPGQLCRGQEILLGFLGPWLQASGSGDTSVTATNICVAICKPCP